MKIAQDKDNISRQNTATSAKNNSRRLRILVNEGKGSLAQNQFNQLFRNSNVMN